MPATLLLPDEESVHEASPPPRGPPRCPASPLRYLPAKGPGSDTSSDEEEEDTGKWSDTSEASEPGRWSDTGGRTGRGRWSDTGGEAGPGRWSDTAGGARPGRWSDTGGGSSAEVARAQLAALEAREEVLASDVRRSTHWQQLQVIMSTIIITKILMLIKLAEALASDVRRSAHWKQLQVENHSSYTLYNRCNYIRQ